MPPKVTWEDREVYEGRFDMQKHHTKEANPIGEQMKSFLTYIKTCEHSQAIYETTPEEIDEYINKRLFQDN